MKQLIERINKLTELGAIEWERTDVSEYTCDINNYLQSEDDGPVLYMLLHLRLCIHNEIPTLVITTKHTKERTITTSLSTIDDLFETVSRVYRDKHYDSVKEDLSAALIMAEVSWRDERRKASLKKME